MLQPTDNIPAQTIPQVDKRTPWGTRAVYRGSLQGTHVFWREFEKRLGTAAWVWLVIFRHGFTLNTLSRKSIARRVTTLSRKLMTEDQAKEQLRKLYAAGLLVDLGDDFRSTLQEGKGTRIGRARQRTHVGTLCTANGYPHKVGLPKEIHERLFKIVTHGGKRAGAGRKKRETPINIAEETQETLINIAEETPKTPINSEINIEEVQSTTQTHPQKANQVPPSVNQVHPLNTLQNSGICLKANQVPPPIGDQRRRDLRDHIKPICSLGFSKPCCVRSTLSLNQPPPVEPAVLRTPAALRAPETAVLRTPEHIYLVASNPSAKGTSMPHSKPSAGTTSKPDNDPSAEPGAAPAKDQGAGGRDFADSGEVEKSRRVQVRPSLVTSGGEAAARLSEAAKQLAEAGADAENAGKLVFVPDTEHLFRRQAHIRALRAAQLGRSSDASAEEWHPVLKIWPRAPEPRGWEKLSTVDLRAAEYLVRMYTAYRAAKFNSRWWFRGKPQTQVWWPKAVAAAHALRTADIPPVAWIAWTHGALWKQKGPVPQQMVFSAKSLADPKILSWCRGTWEDYLPRHVQIPPTMRTLWAEMKQARAKGTLTDPAVSEHLQRLLQKAQLEAEDLQEHLRMQEHEGRWVW